MQRGVEAVDEDTAGQRRALGERQDVGADVLEALMGGGRQESGVGEEGAEVRLLAGRRDHELLRRPDFVTVSFWKKLTVSRGDP